MVKLYLKRCAVSLLQDQWLANRTGMSVAEEFYDKVILHYYHYPVQRWVPRTYDLPSAGKIKHGKENTHIENKGGKTIFKI